MFVPSLSWQMLDFQHLNVGKRPFSFCDIYLQLLHVSFIFGQIRSM